MFGKIIKKNNSQENKKNKGDTHLYQLRELTSNLPSLCGIMEQGSIWDRHREFKVEQGSSFHEILVHSEDDVAIGIDWATAGSIAMEHVHKDEVEYYIVISGKLQCIMPNEIITAGEGEHVFIPKNTPHKCKVLEDVKFLAITIPAAEGMKR